jgi:exosortase E/protease (VPEID-CTERM system)
MIMVLNEGLTRKFGGRIIRNQNFKVWTGLGVLALSELAGLSIRFNFSPGPGTPIWFAKLLPYLNIFVYIFLGSLIAGISTSWAHSRGGRSIQISSYNAPYIFWGWVFAHLSAFAAFAYLSLFVIEVDFPSSHSANLWIYFWLASGLLSGVFLMLAAIPARQWLRLFRQGWRLIFASILIGAGMVIGYATGVLPFLVTMAWRTLPQPTFFAVKWLLQAFGEEIISQPTEFVLGTKQFSVKIGSSCSGYEGIGLMAAFVGFYLWSFRRTLRFPRAFFILPCAIVSIWTVNAWRIALLVMFGTYVSPEIALGGFHSQVGWLGFIAVALGMMAVTQRMAFFASQSTLKSAVEDRSWGGQKTTAYLAPLMALLGTMMLTRVFSSDFDWLYPIRFLGTGAVIWSFWRRLFNLSNLAGRFSWGAIGMGLAVFILWIGVDWGMGESEIGDNIQKSLAEMPAMWSTAWITFRVLGSVITVPIAEELAFRGYLLRRLLSTHFENIFPRFTWVSFLVSSFLFGVLHGRWLVGTAAGMFYAWAIYRRGKAGDAIIAHAATNGFIAVYVLVFRKWEFWV